MSDRVVTLTYRVVVTVDDTDDSNVTDRDCVDAALGSVSDDALADINDNWTLSGSTVELL